MNKKENERSIQTSDNQTSLYKSLSPNSNVTNGEEYIASLTWAMKQDNISNIAVSGIYGAGKSSVINSFIRTLKGVKILRISLAAFEDSFDTPNLESRLENEVLKQIFYSVSSDKIPKSRYRRITSQKWYSNLLPALVIDLLIMGLLYVFGHEQIDSAFEKINSLSGYLPQGIYILFALFFYATSILIVGWIKQNVRIKEVNISNKGSVKLEDRDSVFNKNMDEIVYFFEKTQTKVVVIEDLDRFNKTEIFVALRNLNYILNNNENIAKKGKVVFIYAIRDDVFENNEERTKIFDFIVPIVSYVSSTNSSEVLRQALRFDTQKDKSTVHEISGQFITRISPYISDMRLVLCICNEFNVLKSTLKGRQSLRLDEEKLFALVSFKNLYPKAYAELENEESSSIVRKAFENKKTFIEARNRLSEENRTKKIDELKKIENEALQSVRELKAAMLMALVNPPVAVYSLNINSKNYDYSDILKDDFDINVLRCQRMRVSYIGNQGNSITVTDVEDKLTSNGNYFKRIDDIITGLAESKEQCKEEIESYEDKINDLKSCSIKELITTYGTGFLDSEVAQNEFLVFLLRNGFIDESYSNYINYFHPNSITKDEMNYVLGIRNHKSDMDYSYPLVNVAKVYERIADYEFKQKESLNFDMIDYIITNQQNTPSEVALMSQLSNHSSESMSFIKAYINRGDNISRFILLLCQFNGSFWNDIMNESVTKEKAFYYLELILKYAKTEDIIKQDDFDTTKPLSTFIINSPDSLARLSAVPKDKIISVIHDLEITFYDVQLDDVDQEIVSYVYENNYYALNVTMLRQLFAFCNSDLINIFDEKNYSAVKELDYEPLNNRLSLEFEKYIMNVFLETESKSSEDYMQVNEIIDRLVPNDDLCIQVLDKVSACWPNLGECCNTQNVEYGESKRHIWNYLFNNDRLNCNILNVQGYYELFDLDDDIEKYIDRNADVLFREVDNELLTDEFKNAVLYSDISDSSFTKFLHSVPFEFTISDFNDLGEQKTKILVNERILPYSVASWIKIGELWPSLRIDFARNNAQLFIGNISECKIEAYDLDALLPDSTFGDEEKKKIIEQFSPDNMTDTVAEKISALKFKIDKKNSDAAWKLLDTKNRIVLLTNQADNYSFNELSVLIGDLGDDYSSLVMGKRHRYEIPFNETNNAFLNVLHRMNYVTSKKVDPVGDSSKEQYIIGYVKELA